MSEEYEVTTSDEEYNEAAQKPKESDDEFLSRVRTWFRATSDFESKARTEMLDDLRFVRLGGEWQWPDYAKKNRMLPGGERPMLTDNRVKQYRTSVINQIRQNMPAIKVRPVDDQADVKTAEILQGVIRNIEAVSKADNSKDKAIEFSVDCGRGYFGLMTRYVHDDSWEQEIAYRLLPDPFKVYLDPFSVEPDGSDATVAMIVEDIPRRQFEEEYPGLSLASWQEGGTGDISGWVSEETIRIAEHYEIVETPMELLLLADGRTVWADELNNLPQPIPPVEQSRKTARRRCVWTKICGDTVHDRRELPTQYIPIIPVYGEEWWSEGQHHIQGLIRNAKDPQRLYNFWLSAVAEQVALQPKVPFIAPEGTFEGHEDKWAQANSKNFSYLEYTPVLIGGNVLAGPSRQPPPPIPTGYVEQMQTALEGIKAAVGMQNPAVGAPEGANQSGRAIRSLQMQAAIGTSHFGDNLAKSVEHAGRIIIEMIPHVYDTQRVLRILGEDGTADYAQHDPMAEQAVQKQRNPITGEISTIYNLGVGRYDVRVAAGPSYGTKREEGFDALTQMVQAMPQLGQLAGDLIMRLSDSPYADEIADRLKAALPPQILAATESQDEAPDPQLIAAQQQLQAMQQQMGQMAAELQAAQNDTQSKLQIEQMRMQVEQMKLQQQAALEQAKLQQQAELEREKLMQQAQIEIDKMNLETIKLEAQLQQQHEASEAEEPEEPGEESDNYDLMKAEFEAQEELREQQWRQGIESALGQIAQAVAQSQAPKRVVRDDQGRVIGVEPIGGVH